MNAMPYYGLWTNILRLWNNSYMHLEFHAISMWWPNVDVQVLRGTMKGTRGAKRMN